MNGSIYRLTWLAPLVAAFLTGSFTWSAKPADAAKSLDAIIDNVRQNEALYENIDVLMQTTYKNLKEIPKDKGNPGKDNFKEYKHRQYSIRSVRQDGMFRTEMTGKTMFADKTASDKNRVRMFDGEKTRVAVGNRVGNVITGRSEGGDLMRPHMFFLRPMGIVAPLSTYLQGHKAMAACPTVTWRPSRTLENTYQGEAEFQGLKCHKVWITTLFKGKPHDRWELWLAEDRNYIPVRLVGYTFRFSKDIPVAIGTVSQWRQLKPGIWFPLGIRVTVFDMLKVQREGKHVPIWQEDYVAQEVSLEPKYDVAFFRDLEFAAGTAVYEVNASGDITSSYRKGAPESPGGPERSSTRWLLVIVSIVLIVLFGGLVVIRRKRRSDNAH